MEVKVSLERFDITNCLPSWEVKEEGAVYHRLYYIYDGKVTYYSNNKKNLLTKGYLYLFPIQQAYQITHDPDTPLKCLWFHLALFPPIFNPMLEFAIEENTPLFYLIKVLEALLNNNKRDKDLIIYFLEGLIPLIGKEKKLYVINDHRLEKVLDFIHNNYQKKITNSLLAELVNLNIHYFNRYFRENLNITPQKYLANYRLGKASYLLNQGLDILQTARRVGFEDSKAFSRAFKRNKGVSPSVYQKTRYFQP